jgi:phage shock protein PspC (stress-responsive transcriptional regulator)
VSASMATAAGGIPRLERHGRMLAGVCTGIARHFGVRVRFVRLAFVVLTIAGGIGAALYGLAYIALTSTGSEVDTTDPTAILREAGASWREALGAGIVAAAVAVAAGAGWDVVLPIAAGATTAMALWRSGLGLSRRGRIGAGLMIAGAVLIASALPKLGDLQSFAFALIVLLGGSFMLFGPW